MDHEILRSVILDRQGAIRKTEIVPRRYEIDPAANYVVTGLRRAGKSTLLYKLVQDLVSSGADWRQIVYVDFEDERLIGFTAQDFNDIVQLAYGLTDHRPYFFFDEMQNVKGWEKFARRMADAKERVYITGSNATMLSSEIESTLGGRYMELHVSPYRFDEYLDAVGQPHDADTIRTTREAGRIAAHFRDFCANGGFPESLERISARSYVESVYQKILLGDIALRNKIKNVPALRLLMKKVAEAVCRPVSYGSLYGALKGVGVAVGKATVIDYLDYAKSSYLVFEVQNWTGKFVERESSPKIYFSDNGLLGLFVREGSSSLLENEVAVALRDVFGEDVCYLRSAQTGIDIDFYIPSARIAIQVATELSDSSYRREVDSLVKLSKREEGHVRCLILTMQEQRRLFEDDVAIEVMPVWRFLLEECVPSSPSLRA